MVFQRKPQVKMYIEQSKIEQNRLIFGFEPLRAQCNYVLTTAPLCPIFCTMLQEPCSIGNVPDGPHAQFSYVLLVQKQITHNDAPQSVGLLWMSDQLVVETSTCTTHDAHNRQTDMPLAGFEPAILAGERPLRPAVRRTLNMHSMDKVKSFDRLPQVVHNYHHACRGVLLRISCTCWTQRIGGSACLQ